MVRVFETFTVGDKAHLSPIYFLQVKGHNITIGNLSECLLIQTSSLFPDISSIMMFVLIPKQL